MLIDCDFNGYVDLQTFPKQITLSVPVRINWQKESIVNHGQEGVWYYGKLNEQAAPREIEPFDVSNTYHYLFLLNPKSNKNECSTHQYLIRYWDSSIYVPMMNNLIILVKEIDDRWDITFNSISLVGIDYKA